MKGWAIRVVMLFLLALVGELTALHDLVVSGTLFVLLAFVDLMRTVEDAEERKVWNNKNGRWTR